MNVLDVLESGHQTVLKAVEELPEAIWEQSGACGDWSVKNIIAHLASFEATLVDILRQLTDQDAATPTLDRFFADAGGFNQQEVQARQAQSVAAVLGEYNEHYAEVMRLIEQIPEEKRRQKGILTWYGDTYDLEDFIVYTYYGHKREHTAQMLLQQDRLSALEDGQTSDATT
jgi:hypothetical protein